MTYEQALEKIHSLNKFGSRPGLDRVTTLLGKMGNPQDYTKFIHVAGTNGKGSTCAVVSSILREAGYKTGLFISPFITDFCERIQINNTPIPHEQLAKLTEYVFSFVEKLNAEGIIITEFEFVTALCFEYFKREKVELAVLETGLGGLLDCTNTISENLCAVITPIGLDHTDILGNTVELIAEQKCGIIKKNCPVVSATQSEKAQNVIDKTASALNCPQYFAKVLELDVLTQSIEGTRIKYMEEEINLPLCGEHQVDNLKTALATINALKEEHKLNVTAKAIKDGIESASNPARFEVLSHSPLVVLDGAHNEDGMLSFSNCVKKLIPQKKRVLLMGMLADKDSKASVRHIDGLFEKAFVVPVSNPRARKVEALAELLKEHVESVATYNNAIQGFDKAFETAKAQNSALCICGSLYLAGELRPYIIKKLNK